jgi:hypothetical protein
VISSLILLSQSVGPPAAEQKRFFRFEGGKMLFGPAPNSIRAGSENLTRRLTLQRP